MFIRVFPSSTFSGRSRSGGFCKACFTYTYVLLIRGYSMSIRGFSQFRFQWSRPFLGSFARHVDKHISDNPLMIKVFSQFRFQWSSLRFFVRYPYRQMCDYLGTIQCLYGFFPVSLSVVEVVLGSFARHALHIHMNSYVWLEAIQCQSGPGCSNVG